MPVQRVPQICAWCEPERKAKGLEPKVLGHVDVDVPPGAPAVSHGTCPECFAKAFGRYAKDEDGNPVKLM